MKKIIASLFLIGFAYNAYAFNPGLPVTNTNSLPVALTPGANPSYTAEVSSLTPAATATDIVTICGSATKTVKIIRSEIIGYATGASIIDFFIFKRSTLNTGGTSSAVTPVIFDSTDTAATASVLSYTANPSALGTGAMMFSDHYEMSAATGNSYFTNPWIQHFGINGNKAIILNGVSECLSFSLNGQTLPAGMKVYVNFEWIEY